MARVFGSKALALALVLGCGGSSGEPREGVRAKPKPTKTADKGEDTVLDEGGPGVQEDGSIVSAVDWFHGSLEQAIAMASKDEKLILADVGAYWCPPCHELDEKTFVDPKVGDHIGARYVAVHIDAEKADGPEVVERYGIGAYPTILVLESSGVEKARLVDFVEPEALLEKLESIEQGGNVLDELKATIDTKPDDLEAAYEYGHALALSAKREQADAQFDKVLAGDSKNEAGLAAKVMYDRAMFFEFKLDKDHEGSIALYKELQKKYPDSKQALRAYRQIGRVYNTMGKPKKAIESLDAMIAKKPDDPGLKSSYGWFSFRQKCNPKRGLEVVQAGIEQDPERAGFYYLEAELQHQLGDDAAALVAIRKASELEPKKAYYRRQITRFVQLAGGLGEAGSGGPSEKTAEK
jgi:tetratricopeptide (TPR) repeat protein